MNYKEIAKIEFTTSAFGDEKTPMTVARCYNAAGDQVLAHGAQGSGELGTLRCLQYLVAFFKDDVTHG